MAPIGPAFFPSWYAIKSVMTDMEYKIPKKRTFKNVPGKNKNFIFLTDFRKKTDVKNPGNKNANVKYEYKSYLLMRKSSLINARPLAHAAISAKISPFEK